MDTAAEKHLAAEVAALGPVIETYQATRFHLVASLVGSLFFLTLAFVVFVTFPLRFRDDGVELLMSSLPYLIAFWAAGVVVIVLLNLRARLHLRQVRIRVHQLGLEIDDGHGERIPCLWDDIKEVQTDPVSIDMILLRIRYTVTRRDGSRFTFWAAEMGENRLLELDNTIREKTARKQVADWLEQINFGSGVVLGQHRLSRQGVHRGTDLLPWGDLEGLVTDVNYLTLQRYSGAASWKVSASSQELALAAQVIRELTGIRR